MIGAGVRWPRKPLMIGVCLVGSMAGLVLSRYGFEVAVWLWAGLGALACLLVIFKRAFVLPLLLLLGMGFGFWRGNEFLIRTQRYDQLMQQAVTAEGRVADDPGVNARGAYEFHIQNPILDSSPALPGKLRVRTYQKASVERGDTARVKGKLTPTLGTGRQGNVQAQELVVLARDHTLLERIRRSFFMKVSELIAEPGASLGLGYLVGSRAAIPEDLEEALAVTGLTHIVAVSGYNLTILVAGTRRLFARYSAYQAVVASLGLILAFLALAGWAAPIGRAAVISVVSLMAWYYGRALNPILLLLLGGAITAFHIPFYIWGDVGWYLSILAFCGVLILGPLITATLYKHKTPSIWVQTLIETLSAQLVTLPYMMYLFGKASLIAPLANVLVLPIIPLIMLGVFLTGLTGMIAPSFATLVAIVPHLLLVFQIWLIRWLGEVSWALQTVTITLETMLVLYAVLLITTIALWRRINRRKAQDETPARIDWNMV